MSEFYQGMDEVRQRLHTIQFVLIDSQIPVSQGERRQRPMPWSERGGQPRVLATKWNRYHPAE